MDQNGQKPVVFVFTTAYHPFVGGAEIAISEISKRLKDKFDFIMVTSRMRRDLAEKEARDEGVVVRIGFGTKFDKFLLPIFSIFKVNSLIEDQSIILGVDLSFGALAGAVLKFFNPKTPFIFNIQYGYGDERIASGRGGFIKHSFKFILKEADYITAISTYLLNLAHGYGYIGEEKVIHNGVDLEKFQQNFKNVEIKDGGLGVSTVITVSRLVPKNGVDILIHAVAELKKEIPNIQCNILGDGPELKSLMALARELNLNGSVKFFGHVRYEEIPKYLSEADIFARPSRSEGMGNAFVEALASGLAIVGTKVGGIPDIIKEGETGLFAEIDNPKDLAEKIKILLKNKDLSKKIIENGQKLIKEKFDWDKIAADYGNIFGKKLAAKKRILIATPLFPPDIGGPATYTKTLLEEFPKNGISVRVLSFGGVRRFPKVLRHALYFFRVFRLGCYADIIYAQDPVSVGFPAVLAAKILRKKFILKIVGDYAWEQGMQSYDIKELLDDFLKKKYGFKVELLRKIERIVAQKAETVIVPSEYLKKIVIQWGIDPKKAKVIYNSFDASQIATGPLRSKEEIKEELNLEGRIIVSAGRLVPWKGFSTLIEIMPELIKKFPDLKLVIIGDGPGFENCKLKIENLNVKKHISLLGKLGRKKVIDYLKAADLFVLNTAYEGLSHQILEAMALSVPIVTTNIGGNPELIEDKKSGFLVNYNNKETLTEKISELLSNKNLANSFAEEAKKKVREFSIKRMITDTVEMIKRL